MNIFLRLCGKKPCSEGDDLDILRHRYLLPQNGGHARVAELRQRPQNEDAECRDGKGRPPARTAHRRHPFLSCVPYEAALAGFCAIARRTPNLHCGIGGFNRIDKVFCRPYAELVRLSVHDPVAAASGSSKKTSTSRAPIQHRRTRMRRRSSIRWSFFRSLENGPVLGVMPSMLRIGNETFPPMLKSLHNCRLKNQPRVKSKPGVCFRVKAISFGAAGSPPGGLPRDFACLRRRGPYIRWHPA